MASRFQALTTWTTLEVVSEPFIVMTLRGYTAALEALDVETNESADSISIEENAIGSTENFDAKLEKRLSSEDRLWQHISSRNGM